MPEQKRQKMGRGGYCICPKCDFKTVHQRGVPCQDVRCPNCDAKLMRENSFHHGLLQEKKRKNP